MRPDALVIRHGTSGAPRAVADIMDCPVINAGDGTGEHPTQALLDAATMRRHFGRIEGLKVAICGDITHSRVARSNGKLLPRLGAEVRFAGPPSLIPADFEGSGSIDEAVEGADVVMMLRIQRERLDEDLDDAPGEYLARYGLTAERMARAAPGRGGHASRADQSRRRDRRRAGRRSRAVADHASGRNGRGRADGLPRLARRGARLAARRA